MIPSVPARRLTRRKKLTFVLLLAAAPLVAAALAEFGLRLALWARYGVAGKRYGLWIGDEELGAVHAPNSYNTSGETNDQGFRNSEDVLEPKPAGALRVVCYGGSTTFCYNLRGDEAWPIRLQELLRARRPGGAHDQVLNGGAVMWSLGHALARARRDLPRLHPDVVIIYSGINELLNANHLALQGYDLPAHVARGEFGAVATNYPPCNWLHRTSVAYKLVHNQVSELVHRLAPDRSDAAVYPPDPRPELLENYEQVLRSFLALIRATGGRAVFVIQAQGSDSPQARHLTAYSRAAAPLAAREGALVIDAQASLEAGAGREGSFVSSGVHYTREGAQRLAEVVYAQAFAAEGR